MVKLEGKRLQTPGSTFEDTGPDGAGICSFLVELLCAGTLGCPHIEVGPKLNYKLTQDFVEHPVALPV